MSICIPVIIIDSDLVESYRKFLLMTFDTDVDETKSRYVNEYLMIFGKHGNFDMLFLL